MKYFKKIMAALCALTMSVLASFSAAAIKIDPSVKNNIEGLSEEAKGKNVRTVWAKELPIAVNSTNTLIDSTMSYIRSELNSLKSSKGVKQSFVFKSLVKAALESLSGLKSMLSELCVKDIHQTMIIYGCILGLKQDMESYKLKSGGLKLSDVKNLNDKMKWFAGGNFDVEALKKAKKAFNDKLQSMASENFLNNNIVSNSNGSVKDNIESSNDDSFEKDYYDIKEICDAYYDELDDDDFWVYDYDENELKDLDEKLLDPKLWKA